MYLRCFSPIGLSTEEPRENIYDEPHRSKECSSPPPTGPEYYNQSMFLRNKESQHGAVVRMPPSAARTKPIPPPKPKKPINTGTHTHIIHQHCNNTTTVRCRFLSAPRHMHLKPASTVHVHIYNVMHSHTPYTCTHLLYTTLYLYNTQIMGCQQKRRSTMNRTKVWSVLRPHPQGQNTTTKVSF
jgi:hypothetical protein